MSLTTPKSHGGLPLSPTVKKTNNPQQTKRTAIPTMINKLRIIHPNCARSREPGVWRKIKSLCGIISLPPAPRPLRFLKSSSSNPDHNHIPDGPNDTRQVDKKEQKRERAIFCPDPLRVFLDFFRPNTCCE